VKVKLLAEFVRGEVLLPEGAGRRVRQRYPVRDVQTVRGGAVGQRYEPPSRSHRDEFPLAVAADDVVVGQRASGRHVHRRVQRHYLTVFDVEDALLLLTRFVRGVHAGPLVLSIVVQEQVQVALLTTQFKIVPEGTALRQEAESREERPILEEKTTWSFYSPRQRFFIFISSQ